MWLGLEVIQESHREVHRTPNIDVNLIVGLREEVIRRLFQYLEGSLNAGIVHQAIEFRIIANNSLDESRDVRGRIEMPVAGGLFSSSPIVSPTSQEATRRNPESCR